AENISCREVCTYAIEFVRPLSCSLSARHALRHRALLRDDPSLRAPTRFQTKQRRDVPDRWRNRVPLDTKPTHRAGDREQVTTHQVARWLYAMRQARARRFWLCLLASGHFRIVTRPARHRRRRYKLPKRLHHPQPQGALRVRPDHAKQTTRQRGDAGYGVVIRVSIRKWHLETTRE